MTEKKKPKHLSTHNTKGFFDDMKPGDEFTYNARHYETEALRRKAAVAGLAIETMRIDDFGLVTCVVTGRPACAGPAYDPEPKAGRLSELADMAVRARFCRGKTGERAAFLARAVRDGMLLESVEADAGCMRDYEFECEYGVPYAEAARIARELESFAGADRALVDAAVRAGAWPGARRNWDALETAGLIARGYGTIAVADAARLRLAGFG